MVEAGEAAGKAEGAEDAEYDRDDRNGAGVHTDGETVDDHGGGAGFGLARDALHPAILVGRVPVGGFTDDDTGHQTGDGGAGDAERDDPLPAEAEEDDDDQDGGHIDAALEGVHQDLHAGFFAALDEEDAEDGQDNADGGNDHGRLDGGQLAELLGEGRHGCAERRGGENGAAVGLVEVGAHTGDVAHVVGDGGGVARIVFGDAGFDFADEVGANVGSLGVDTAADAGEEGHQRGADTEAKHGGGDLLELIRGVEAGGHDEREAVGHVVGRVDDVVEDEPPEPDHQQAEADDDHTHDGAGAEGDGKALVEGLAGALRGTARGHGGGLHTEVAAQRREQRTGKEGDRHEPVLEADKGHDHEDHEEGDDDLDNNLELGLQVGHGAFGDIAGDLHHALVTGIGGFHLIEQDPGHDDGQQCSDRGQIRQPR